MGLQDLIQDTADRQIAYVDKMGHLSTAKSGPLFTERYGVLSLNLAKFRSREIGCYSDCITLKFHKLLGGTTAEPRCLPNIRAIGKKSKRDSSFFETSRDLTERRLPL